MITSYFFRCLGFMAALLLGLGSASITSAQTQALPVGLIQNTIQGLQNRGTADRGELPRWNPRKPFLGARVNLFSGLAVGVYTAAGRDMANTQSLMPHFHEADPLARPLLRLPPPLYYASGTLFATSVNWLGLKMQRSSRWHKICWLPQAISIAGNLSGFAYTRSNSIATQSSSTRAKNR
jgi:hypothetical protein